jgi:hypothetical protein
MNTRLRFDTAQAAEYAGCHVETIRHAAQAGDLHGGQRTKNGRWSFRLECLDAWLDGKPCEHQKAAVA